MALTPDERKAAKERIAHIEALIDAIDAKLEAAPRSTELDAIYERAALLKERAAQNLLLKAK